MLKGKFSSRRRVTEEVDAMSGLANLSDVMLVFACGLMAAIILNWNVDLSKTRVEILQREQMKELDRQAIEERGIPSIDLMERAAAAVAEAAPLAQSTRMRRPPRVESMVPSRWSI